MDVLEMNGHMWGCGWGGYGLVGAQGRLFKNSVGGSQVKGVS